MNILEKRSESLAEQPWIAVNSESDISLMIKFLFKDNSYELLLCNGKKCYYESMEENELKERNKVRPKF